MKKLITTVALLLCCSAAIAQTTGPIVVQAPDGRILQCITSGGVTRCF